MADPVAPTAEAPPPPLVPRARSSPLGSKLTPTARALILETLRAGAPRSLAAQRAGVPRSLLTHWLNRGEQQQRGFWRAFYDEVLKVEAEVALAMCAVIQREAVKGDSKSAQWWLRTRMPKEFGERTQIEVKVASERDAMLDVLRTSLPEPQYRNVLAQLAARDTTDDREE